MLEAQQEYHAKVLEQFEHFGVVFLLCLEHTGLVLLLGFEQSGLKGLQCVGKPAFDLPQKRFQQLRIIGQIR